MTSMYYLGPLEEESEIIESLRQSRVLSIDTETISLKDRTCIGIGLCSGEHRWYFPMFPEENKWKELLGSKLTDGSVRQYYHNYKYDRPVLEQAIGKIAGNVEDSYLLAHNMGIPAGLEAIGKNMLGFTDMFSIQDLLKATGKRNANMLDVPEDQVALKCMNDVRATWYAWEKLSEKASAEEWSFYQTDMKLLKLFEKMEAKGLGLNQPLVNQLFTEYANKVADTLIFCQQQLGFEPGSPQQVGNYLTNQGCRLPRNPSGKGVSTDEDALIQLGHPIGDIVLDYRSDRKLLSTYITPWLEQIRCFYHFRGDLSTGRLASGGLEGINCGHVCRNIQNVPPDMRAIFVPDSGMFTWLDYSQIELRIFAHLSQDPEMVSTYKANGDIHFETQQGIWPSSSKDNQSLRLAAKTANFTMVFDGTANTLHKSIKGNAYKFKTPVNLSRYDVNNIIDKWKKKYNTGFRWMQLQQQKTEPYAETMFGRKMKLPDAGSEWEYKHQGKCRINYPVQGTAADIIKSAMILCDEADLDMRIQVHDELVFDGSVDDTFRSLAFDSIGSAFGLHTPFEVKQGAVWK